MYMILWVEENKYYNQASKKNRWVTMAKSASKFHSLEEAEKQAGNARLQDHGTMQYITYNKEDGSIGIPTMTKEEAEAAYEELIQAVEAFGKVAQKIPSIMQYYAGIQSEQDKLQEDLLHKIEFMPSNNILFVKYSRMLKKCRLVRREAKDRIAYMLAIKASFVTNLLDNHNKYFVALENRSYTPRVAKDIFNEER